ncbi:MAG: asparagine synthase (glutamine-hydrolyzing) [Desulfobacterales bacterium]|nr:MAG: asparagine synthase (glutamine-hydrolyzing) [Desulfobacterales bacterium]
MCGVAGLICFNEMCSEQEHVSMIDQMNRCQAHRGPDDNGVVSLSRICLGSTRLSILDLTDAGHMPMSTDKKDKWIAYNGEVYNFKSLREELRAKGYTFRSGTDTEVILYAYEEWGKNCLERFVGMFAFALYDMTEGRILLVRDRFGIKPLYYVKQQNHLLFASEIKSLTAFEREQQINKQRLIEWNLYRNIDSLSSQTILENVKAVLPGQLVEISPDGSTRAEFYYSTLAQTDRKKYTEYKAAATADVVADIESALDRAVEDRLVSDAPVGTLCSGGLDSSLISAVAAKHMKNIAAFHVSIANYPELDERKYAEGVSKSLGIELFCQTMDGQQFREWLTEAIYYSDLPLTHPNSVAFFLICKFAKQQGVKVLLSGEGADELFGGYTSRYRQRRQVLRLCFFLMRLPDRLRRKIELVGLAGNNLPTTSFFFRDLLPYSIGFIDRYLRLELRALCKNSYIFEKNNMERTLLGEMLADLTDFLSPLLRRLDRMSMGASVESRVPFLDHRLVHKCINLPLTYRLRGKKDKWLLKKIAERYLPRNIVHRKKVGFPLPLVDFLGPVTHSHIFDDGFCLNCLELSGTGLDAIKTSWKNNIQAFFTLLSLEIWGRLFIMREPVEQVKQLLNNSGAR